METSTTEPSVTRIPGLTFRNLRDESDYERLAALIEAARRADGDEWLPDAATLKAEYEHRAGFDPRTDLFFAEVYGAVAGYGSAERQVRDDLAVYMTMGAVHPAYRRRGLGRTILRRNETRLREIARDHEDPSGRAFGAWITDREIGGRALLLAEGYRPIRYYFTMIRPLDDIPEVPLPDGLEIRRVTPDALRTIFDADNEAFRDHWGHMEATDEDFESLLATPDLDTSLWRVAWDGDQVAGSVMTFVWKSENDKLGVRRGWLEHISVRRPWRRRGLAKALIASAMAGLREAGQDDVMLGVDAGNPTGAPALYESLGFRVKDSGTAYRKAW